MGVRAGARGPRHRQAQGPLRPVHRRTRGRGDRRRNVHQRRPIDGAAAGAVAKGTPADVDGPSGAPVARPGGGPACPGKERAKYLFRIARILQERVARVRRPRVDGLGQADQGEPRRRRPARRRALLVLRRLGRQARVRVPGPDRPAARRRRPDHPVELPAAHARLEDRPGARRREHGHPQAGLDDAPLGAPLRRRLSPGRAAAGVVNIVTGPARSAAIWPATGASTRSRSPARPRSAGRSPRPSPGPTRP